ncbi:MAG: hypothetical protein J6333_07680 [Planctomycetes bacterium]|nr:hypothetical protein [Planctomycetota bacterium]
MPDDLALVLRSLKSGPAGAPKVLITGGATCEDIDPVRYITNRSTGKMGVAVARAALALGMQPLLLLGAGAVRPPVAIPCVRFRSTADLQAKLERAFPWCDALVMTAAVADYTPAAYSESKIHKAGGDLVIRLRRTPDLLLALSRHPARAGKRVCGFSLDTTMDLEEGRAKMAKKKLDMLVVNTTAAFAGDQTAATILTPGAAAPTPPRVSKYALGKAILARLLAGMGK